MTTYHFTLSERELEVILAALARHTDDIAEARALQVRLDAEADRQFAVVD